MLRIREYKALKRTLAKFCGCIFLNLLFVVAPGGASAGETTAAASSTRFDDVVRYISKGWDVLTRSMSNCQTVIDPKAPEQSVLYLPADVAENSAVREIENKCHIKIEHLPAVIKNIGAVDINKLSAPHGLLYLEHSYVVPGGMFNEMYGWDSYFIIRGLLRDGRVDLAQGMVENFFYEIEHYGAVLNSNRAYHLTRSQPPFLSSMILAVYEAKKARGENDLAWLAKAFDYAARSHVLWNQEPHLAGNTGLARYFDFGDGPVPEVALTDNYYQQVTAYFMQHAEGGHSYLAGDKETATPVAWPRFAVTLCPVANSPWKLECQKVENVGLNGDYYKGDRAMRESGFDISFRFEPFSAGTHHYAAVCLNSLLYKTEKDLQHISMLLGKSAQAAHWKERAAARAQKIQQYLWDAQQGMYFDFDFTKGQRSHYDYASTFYPLWAGLASAGQARLVRAKLSLFEQAGGLAMSHTESKAQWDYPYGWAPVQLLAIEGLRRYGYNDDADRLSDKFLTMVAENFRRDGTIREKYNVVTRSSETRVEVGYQVNVVGFGWTNGAFVELLNQLKHTH